MPKNYYIILGVSADSTKADIKAAYRRLAKELHPDYYGEDQTPFQVLQEAYSVLSDPKSRRQYDALLKEATEKRAPLQPQPPHYDQEIIEPLSPHGRPSSQQTERRGQSFAPPGSVFDTILDQFSDGLESYRQSADFPLLQHQVEVTLSPGQAQSGGTLSFNLPFRSPCPWCLGRGGAGFSHCQRCGGSGYRFIEKNIVLPYPAGIRNNQFIQLTFKPSSAEEIRLTVTIRIC